MEEDQTLSKVVVESYEKEGVCIPAPFLWTSDVRDFIKIIERDVREVVSCNFEQGKLLARIEMRAGEKLT